jgi:alanine racemase
MLSWIEIKAENVRSNYRIFKKILGTTSLAPVIKSNAYGHGLKEIYQAIAPENPEWLAVNYVAEGQLLRSFGYKGRILVVGPFDPSEINQAHQNCLEMFLGHEEGLDAWIKAASKPSIHLEFDTGMSRQGFRPEISDEIAERILPFKNLVAGLCMHFANVEDVTEHEYANEQLRRFEIAKKSFAARGIQPLIHAASSASALILDESRFGLARVGISMYGFWPSQATKISYKQLHGALEDLKPVLTWKSKITSINHVAQGQYVGYGCTFKARHDMIVAVVPVGYFEGYPRLASGSQAYVLIKGERCPIVGRICMNMMMVDVSDLSDKIKVGDVVTLIGVEGKEIISAGDVASWAETIHYELVTRLNPAIERKLV